MYNHYNATSPVLIIMTVCNLKVFYRCLSFSLFLIKYNGMMILGNKNPGHVLPQVIKTFLFSIYKAKTDSVLRREQ